MAEERRKYTKDYKEAAVAMAERADKTISHAARELGIHASMLTRWRSELRDTEGYSEAPVEVVEKKELKSGTDTDCGYIHQGRKQGLGYRAEMTVDTKNGIITGYYLANRWESDVILKHLEKQKRFTGLAIQKLGLDAGYDVGAVHRGLEMLGITGYTGLRY
jgi:hypothetical protein